MGIPIDFLLPDFPLLRLHTKFLSLLKCLLRLWFPGYIEIDISNSFLGTVLDRSFLAIGEGLLLQRLLRKLLDLVS
jgi:hypothetical protein